ncbi:hypothetical protein BHM03_00045078 [Ensete ventricosum]|nr:hypothetical protein BHM03_00045078 [Ensete ventricosum]
MAKIFAGRHTARYRRTLSYRAELDTPIRTGTTNLACNTQWLKSSPTIPYRRTNLSLVWYGTLVPSAFSNGSGSREQCRISRFSLFFSLFFLVPWPIPPEIDHPTTIDDGQNQPLPLDNSRRRSKSTVTDRFRVVTGRKQPQSMVPPSNEWFAYRSAGEPVRTGGTHQYYKPWLKSPYL